MMSQAGPIADGPGIDLTTGPVERAEVPAPRQAPRFIGRPGPTEWHRLNPLTRLVIAGVSVAAAVLLGGVTAPLALALAAVILPALVAGVLDRLLRMVVLLALPLAISAAIVNVLFSPAGGRVLMELGPLRPTAEGMALAVEVVVRVLVMSGAVVLFYMTTRPSELVADLERRGIPPRLAFIVGASVTAVPAMLERARAVIDAQRARGLDTSGGIRGRVRGIVPMVGPTVMGAVAEVDQRAMALEARGFSRPGRRTLLWAPPDSGRQRLARWLLTAALVALLAARLSGLVPRLP